MGVLVGIVAFLSELGLLVGVGIAGWRLTQDVAHASIGVGIAVAVALPILVAALWGAWLAPRARWRLDDPARLVAICGLFVVAGGLLAAAGLPSWGVALAVVGSASAAAGRRFPFPGHD